MKLDDGREIASHKVGNDHAGYRWIAYFVRAAFNHPDYTASGATAEEAEQNLADKSAAWRPNPRWVD